MSELSVEELRRRRLTRFGGEPAPTLPVPIPTAEEVIQQQSPPGTTSSNLQSSPSSLPIEDNGETVTDDVNDEAKTSGVVQNLEGRLLVKLAELSPDCPIGCLHKVLRDVLAGVLKEKSGDDIILEAVTRAGGLSKGMELLEARLPKDQDFLIGRFIDIRPLFSDRAPEVVAEQMIQLAKTSPFDPAADDSEHHVNIIVEGLFHNPAIGTTGDVEEKGAGTDLALEFPVPTSWDPAPGWVLVDLPPHSDEYARVAHEYYADGPSHYVQDVGHVTTTITKITRIQNPGLWRLYQLKRSLIKEKVGEHDLNERNLWHGTGLDIAKTISIQGFDMRVGVTNGRVWGDGVYFAPRPSLAVTFGVYAAKNKSGCVLYSRGVCGRATQGYRGLRRPPSIDPRDPTSGFYDSCFNDARDMTIIFDNSQVYPDYIVYFDYETDDYDYEYDDF